MSHFNLNIKLGGYVFSEVTDITYGLNSESVIQIFQCLNENNSCFKIENNNDGIYPMP